MFSALREYRVVTAYGGQFTVQHRYPHNDDWIGGWPSYATVEQAVALIVELIERDNFVPEVVSTVTL